MNSNIKRCEEKENKKMKKALKVAKHRPFKNFMLWFAGFISCVLILAGTAFLLLKLIPLKSILGSENEYVSEEVSDKSILDAILNFEEYEFKDLPILFTTIEDAIENAGLDSFIKVDFEGLKDVNISSPDLLESIGANIEVIATIESLGGVKILGDFGKLDAMIEVKEVETKDLPNENGTDFNPKLYYYYNSENVLVRAFDNEYKRVSGAEGQKLYYPALKYVKLLEMADIMSDRIGEDKIVSLLSVFSTIDSNNIFAKIIGDKKISEMGDISLENIKLLDIIPYQEDDNNDGVFETDNSKLYAILCDVKNLENTEANRELLTIDSIMGFDSNKIRLCSVISYEGNEEIYKILCDAAKQPDYTKLTVGDFEKFTLDDVKLLSVIPYQVDDDNDGVLETDNSELYKIVLDVKNLEDTKENRESLTLKDIKGIKVESINFTTVLRYSGNEELYKILCQAIKQPDYTKITVGDLFDFELANISLDSVLPYEENKSLYGVIMEAKGIDNYLDVTIKTLTGFDVQTIPLYSILDYNENTDVFEILLDATISDNPERDYKKVNLYSLARFNISKIFLTHILPYEKDLNEDGVISKADGDIDNKDIYQILCDATSTPNYKDLTVDKLSKFNHENIKLTSVLPYQENERIYKIILDATPANNYEEITLEDLLSFNQNDIRLSSVIEVDENGSTGNKILDKLLEDTDNPVTLGNCAQRIDELTFLEVYPDEGTCFGTTKARCTQVYYQSIDGDFYLKDAYKSTFDSTDNSIRDEIGYKVYLLDGDYYVQENAMIYFLYEFENSTNGASNFSENGHALKWIHREIKISDLSGFKDAVGHMEAATIRMLEDTGVLSHRDIFETKNWYNLTLNEFMTEIERLLGTLS